MLGIIQREKRTLDTIVWKNPYQHQNSPHTTRHIDHHLPDKVSPPLGKCLPMIIKCRNISAQHGTGAERGGFIPSDLSQELKLEVRKRESDRKTSPMGNGKVVRALERVEVIYSFAKEAEKNMKYWCNVLHRLRSWIPNSCRPPRQSQNTWID